MVPMNSAPSPDPGSDRTPARRRGLAGGLLLAMLASWLLMLSPLPFSLFSGLTGLLALVLLVPLIVQAVRERRWSMAVIGALLGVPATLMIITGAALSLVFYGPMAELEQCHATAITEQARIQCDDAAQGSMAQWVSGLFGG
jgi:integral membrane sensor domain MASE1